MYKIFSSLCSTLEVKMSKQSVTKTAFKPIVKTLGG